MIFAILSTHGNKHFAAFACTHVSFGIPIAASECYVLITHVHSIHYILWKIKHNLPAIWNSYSRSHNSHISIYASFGLSCENAAAVAIRSWVGCSLTQNDLRFQSEWKIKIKPFSLRTYRAIDKIDGNCARNTLSLARTRCSPRSKNLQVHFKLR